MVLNILSMIFQLYRGGSNYQTHWAIRALCMHGYVCTFGIQYSEDHIPNIYQIRQDWIVIIDGFSSLARSNIDQGEVYNIIW
jgi:hypothetical protein